jgi:hypothetical protein
MTTEAKEIKFYASGISEIPGMRIAKNFGYVAAGPFAHRESSIKERAVKLSNGEANAIINLRDAPDGIEGDAVLLEPITSP